MTDVLSDELRRLGAVVENGTDRDRIERALRAVGIRLPETHITFLSNSNGVLAYRGYFRLFGVGCDRCIDLTVWNDAETWKFAWPDRLVDYFCFGETAWGDQYAYRISELVAGIETVYMLDAFEMNPDSIASTFDEFLQSEFVRCAREPYDEMLLRSAQVIGPLDWQTHITYVPSILISGEEQIEHVRRMDARACMVINGDIASELVAHGDGVVAAVENYVDARGRLRTRINWARDDRSRFE
jgi:hypothetical protein